VSTDARLEPFAPAIRERYAAYQKALAVIEQHEGGLAHFAEGYKSMGFQVDASGGVRYREWAPGAIEARLIGDFSEVSLYSLT
jgi:1,4-alpha-glucan branching enzyme